MSLASRNFKKQHANHHIPSPLLQWLWKKRVSEASCSSSGVFILWGWNCVTRFSDPSWALHSTSCSVGSLWCLLQRHALWDFSRPSLLNLFQAQVLILPTLGFNPLCELLGLNVLDLSMFPAQIFCFEYQKLIIWGPALINLSIWTTTKARALSPHSGSRWTLLASVQQLFHTGLQNWADCTCRQATPSLFFTVGPPTPINLYLDKSKVSKIVVRWVEASSHSSLGGPQRAPGVFYPPSLSSSCPVAFLPPVLEMQSEPSFSNRISRICSSLSERGVQKPQEWSCVCFLFGPWQFFSNMHSDPGALWDALYSLSGSVLLAGISSWGHFASKSVFWISFVLEKPTWAVSKDGGMPGPGCGLGWLLPAGSRVSGEAA